MIDGRKTVQKGMKGYLMLSNEGKEWHVILEELLNQHGTIAALARELNLDRQTISDWVSTERREGRMKVIKQPPYRYEAVR